MKYQDEETQGEYYKLDTDLQVYISQLEEKLATLQWALEVVDVETEFVPSQIIIRITK